MSINPRLVPSYLKSLPQWLLWRLEDRGGKKPTKIPYSTSGQLAKSNDPATWASYEQALETYQRGGYDGIGFVLCEGDRLVGIDLDDCIGPDGMPSAAAIEIIERFGLVAYIEISPSGKGLRLFTYGTAERSGKGTGDNKWIEVYDHTSPRYLTITGNALHGYTRSIKEGADALAWLHQKYMIKDEPPPVARPVPIRPSNMSERDILERAENAANGSEFRRLYNGDAGSDHSSADLAFCNMLAFWCACDAGQMDRIFRGSGLMRPKWDRSVGKSGTYGESTIAKAISDCRETYDPTRGRAETPAPRSVPSGIPMEPDISDKLLCKGVDDEGNAQAVYLLHGKQFVFCDVYGWLHWCGTHWKRHGAEGRLERAVVNTLILRRKAAVGLGNEGIVKTARPKATNVRNAMFLFRSMVEVHVDDFDRDPDLLNCANGTIHLPTGELRKHNPADHLTYCTKIQLKLDADDTEWVSFLRDAVAQADTPNELAQEMVAYLQKCCGYSLSGNTSEEVLWYIYGPPRSGKGTFTETLYEILGTPLSTEVDFTTFTRDRDNDANNFDLAPLKPARMLFASESERHQRLNGSKVKALTGGNMVRCSFKGKDHFSYRPQYKIWLSSNHLPNGDPDDDALWGRLRLIVFPNSHLGIEDKGLKQRMRSRENLEGVLAWAVRGAQSWYTDRDTGLATPGAVEDQTKAARDEVDTVGQWAAECLFITGNGEHILTNADLYQGYTNWAEDNGVTPKKKTSLTRALKAKGITQDPKPRNLGGKTHRVWTGIQWQG